ncbi:hypothetical protein NL108_016993 [Boleophthalmus pectinirostris]|nr:hypothetical protein NL108_016993 [Boleophthalmus pectinirostris]
MSQMDFSARSWRDLYTRRAALKSVIHRGQCRDLSTDTCARTSWLESELELRCSGCSAASHSSFGETSERPLQESNLLKTNAWISLSKSDLDTIPVTFAVFRW